MKTIILNDDCYPILMETNINVVRADQNIWADEAVAYVRMKVDRENDYLAPCRTWAEVEEKTQMLLDRLKPVILERMGNDEKK